MFIGFYVPEIFQEKNNNKNLTEQSKHKIKYLEKGENMGHVAFESWIQFLHKLNQPDYQSTKHVSLELSVLKMLMENIKDVHIFNNTYYINLHA